MPRTGMLKPQVDIISIKNNYEQLQTVQKKMAQIIQTEQTCFNINGLRVCENKPKRISVRSEGNINLVTLVPAAKVQCAFLVMSYHYSNANVYGQENNC